MSEKFIRPSHKPDLDDPKSLELDDFPRRKSHDNVLLIKPAYARTTGDQTGDEERHSRTDLLKKVSDAYSLPVEDVEKALDIADVDREAFYHQWSQLREVYERYTSNVHVLDPLDIWEEHLMQKDEEIAPPWEVPDMVFAANQSLPYPDRKAVMMSEMATDARADEVYYLEAWYKENGYATYEFESDVGKFEGMGDAIWHPGRRLLWGGVGPRTDREAYEEIAQRLDTDVIVLDPETEVGGDEFFHLDICFSVLDERSVMLIPDLFSDDDLDIIENFFENVIECPLEEGLPSKGYACNSHCIDGENVVLQKNNEVTARRLRDAGYRVHEVNTRESIDKCSGSVFCSKIMLP